MKLPDAVVDKLHDRDSPVTHAAVIEGDDMIIRYTCDGKVIGQTMSQYTAEAYVDWFRSIINEMDPGTGDSTKKNKVKLGDKRKPHRAAQSHRPSSRRKSRRRS